jgi:hypothetical protein
VAGIDPRDLDLVAASTDDVAKTLGRWVPSTKERYYQVRRRKAQPGRLAAITRRAKYTITEWPPNGLSRRLSHVALSRALAECGITAPVGVFDHHRAASRILDCAFSRSYFLVGNHLWIWKTHCGSSHCASRWAERKLSAREQRE